MQDMNPRLKYIGEYNCKEEADNLHRIFGPLQSVEDPK